MKRQILFLFGYQSCVPRDALLAARELGYRTVVLGAKQACCMPDLADESARVDLNRADEVVALARAFHRVHPIHAVVGYGDPTVPAAARIAADLGLPGNPVEVADAARDKVLMKERFAAANIPIAPYTLAADEDDAVAWASRTGYPVVVKPLRGSASQGVIRADSEQELRTAYRRVRRIVREYGLDTGGRSNAQQLVEHYLDGSEVSVELLVRDGTPHVLCLFEKPQPLHGPFFEETIYVTPTRLPTEWRLEIENLAVRAVVALGLRHGPAHCELRLSSAGPFVLEIGARLIGGSCSRSLGYALGEDIHSYILRSALGEEVPVPRQRPVAVGSMMLPIPKEGRLLAIRGMDLALKVPGIRDTSFMNSPGDVIVPFPEQSCYVGFLNASGETMEAVTDALVRAAELIELDLDPLVWESWTREIGDHRSFQAPAEQRIRALDPSRREEIRKVVLPIVAGAYFDELPPGLAMEQAGQYVDSQEEDSLNEASPTLWLVADDRGVALGLVMGNTGSLLLLGVLPPHQRSGLGEALVRSMMAHFARWGCTRIEVLLDQRQPAVPGLFQRLGFAPGAADAVACCTCSTTECSSPTSATCECA